MSIERERAKGVLHFGCLELGKYGCGEDTKLSCALHFFLLIFGSSKEKEEEKASCKRSNQGMKLSHLLVRKNPNSSHVWDLFVGFNWDLMFVLILFWFGLEFSSDKNQYCVKRHVGILGKVLSKFP